MHEEFQLDTSNIKAENVVRIPEELLTYFDPSVEQHVNCSSCRAPLFDAIIIRDSDRITKVTAVCPHCKDKSFQKTIKGELIFGNTDYSSYGEVDMIKLETDSNNKITYCEAVIYPRKVKEFNGR